MRRLAKCSSAQRAELCFAAIVIVCVLGSLAAFIMSAPRVYYAMARDGLFLKSVARIHPRFGTPARAIMVQGVIASILVALGTFEEIIAYFFFVAVLFLGLTVAGLFVIRRKPQQAETIILTAGYPFTPIAFLTLVVIMLILLATRNPREAALGSFVVLAGWPVFILSPKVLGWIRKRRAAEGGSDVQR